ncbi:MAG: sensor histidine kinase [Myxococcaceae bacterium]|nr:sensor histidine kinase [Myxococcaceae bacterium]
MRRSIRYQLLALFGAMLVGTMVTYLALASRIVTADKLATVYDVNALLAATVADQIDSTLDALSDKLKYFAAEGSPNEARAKALFDADDEVLSLELWKRASSGGFEKTFSFIDLPRLQSLNLAAGDLEHARKEYPVPLESVAAAGLVVQNASLQPDLALLRVAVATSNANIVAVADLRPERLLKVVQGAGVYRVFVVDARGAVLAHPDPQKVLGHMDLSALPVVKDALDAKVARGSRDYGADDGDVVASYARLERGSAAVVVETPRAEVFRATRELQERSILFAIALMSVTLIAAVYFSRRVTAPLRTLELTMARVSKGDFTVAVEVTSQNEIGAVATAFNEMTKELGKRNDELERKNALLVQSEKLSAIGELSAGLAHEVKNPMVGIVGFAQLGKESADLDEAKEYFGLIDNDAQRANSILQRLLEFARPPDVERERLEIRGVVDGAVKLVAHQLQLQGVRIETRYAEGLPDIIGNGNQLRQVLVNLMMNAGQAMEQSKEKKLYVEASGADWTVLVSVKDTGPGMAPDVRKRLFEPFFTTKPRGKGTGLGLSISRSIIEEHKGELRVESEIGAGATFVIRLPAAPPATVQPKAAAS